jgi:acyl carrier protein
MSADEISALLAAAIAACLKRSGRSAPRIDPYARVIDGIAGFDSLCGIETTLELESELGIDLGDNLFVKEVDGRPRARTFNEVVGLLISLANGGDHGRKQKA